MASNPDKGHHCQNVRMRMTTLSVSLLSGGQVKSEVFMPYYLITPASSLLCLFLLHRPQRSHWGSSHLPRAVNRGGTHLWECQLRRRQAKKLRSTVQLPFPTHSVNTWPHMCSQYWNNESSLPAAAIQIKLWQFLQWYKWGKKPLAHIYSVWIPWRLYVHIWQLRIWKHNVSVHQNK